MMIGLTVLMILIALALWARFEQLSGGDERLVHQGAKSLHRAILGDTDAYEEAEASFSQASRAVVVDGYPLFALELTQQLRRGDIKVASPELEGVIELLKSGRIKQASEALGNVPNSEKYHWVKRLLDDMLRPLPKAF